MCVSFLQKMRKQIRQFRTFTFTSANSIIPFKITSEREPNKIPFKLEVADFQNCDDVSKIATFF